MSRQHMVALVTGLSLGVGALAIPTAASAGGGCWGCAPVYGGPVYYVPRYYAPTYYAPNYYPAYWAPVYSPYLVGWRPRVAPVVAPVVAYGPAWRPSTWGGGYWRDPYWNWRRW